MDAFSIHFRVLYLSDVISFDRKENNTIEMIYFLLYFSLKGVEGFKDIFTSTESNELETINRKIIIFLKSLPT